MDLLASEQVWNTGSLQIFCLPDMHFSLRAGYHKYQADPTSIAFEFGTIAILALFWRWLFQLIPIKIITTRCFAKLTHYNPFSMFTFLFWNWQLPSSGDTNLAICRYTFINFLNLDFINLLFSWILVSPKSLKSDNEFSSCRFNGSVKHKLSYSQGKDFNPWI